MVDGAGPLHADAATVAEAANIAHTLPKPSRIKVKQDGKYWRVLDYDFKPVGSPR